MSPTTSKTPDDIAIGALDPHERLLWAGRPEAHVIIRVWRRRLMARRAVGLAVLVAVAALALRAGALEFLTWDVVLQPSVLVTVAVTLLGLALLSALNSRRFERYARSLSYAITDRRLLVLENGKIVDDFPPERLSRVTVRRRTKGFGDVVFGRHYQAGSEGRSAGGKRDPVHRERDVVAFKALPNAGEMQDRLVSWLKGHKLDAIREVATVDLASSGGSAVADPSAAEEARTEAGARSVRQDRLGFRIALPASWEIRVRRKDRPRGSAFVDNESWRQPEELDDWTVVRADGRMHCSIEAEVFETAPTVDFDRTVGGRMTAAVAGKVAESERHVEIGGLPGFSVTRRREVVVDSVTGQAVRAASAIRERHTVLHDGRRQVYIVSTWPEDSSELERVVDAAVRSVQLEG